MSLLDLRLRYLRLGEILALAGKAEYKILNTIGEPCHENQTIVPIDCGYG